MKNSVVERVYGYTGASGLIQAFAAGYFIWDLIVSTRHIGIFGLGIWAHAVSALCVFSFGFVSVDPIGLVSESADVVNSGRSSITMGQYSFCTSCQRHS